MEPQEIEDQFGEATHIMKDAKSTATSSGSPRVDFETLLNFSDIAVMHVSADGTPLYMSEAVEKIFGWTPDKLRNNLADLVYLGNANANSDVLQKVLTGLGPDGAHFSHAEIQVRSAFGPLRWAEVAVFPATDDADQANGFLISFRDISKRKDLESLLEAANQTDPLTGLFNRRAFEDTLKREWSIALREKTHTTLIKVSLDRFDALVESYGQSAADDSLEQVAKTLKETARRPADVAARTAGSEFAVLLPRTHQMGAETISAYIQMAIQDLAIPNVDRGDGVLTASVGAACAIAEQTGASESFEFILEAADNCVFQARQEGGNRVKTAMTFLGR